MGYPRSNVLGTAQATLTRGLISAIREDQNSVVYVQTDAALNPGSSGGALVNMRGKLIGIVSATVRGSEGLGLAVATESIEAFLAAPADAPAGRSSSALPSSVAGDPTATLIGQTLGVCEGSLRLELAVEEAALLSDGTAHLLVRVRNTGTVAGNLLLKVRLTDERGRSFNTVNPRDRSTLGEAYAAVLAQIRRAGIDAVGADAAIRPGSSDLVHLAFLAAADASSLRLVPESPC